LKKTIPLVEAASLVVSRSEESLVSEFDIALLVRRLFRDKHLDDIPLRIKKQTPESFDLKRVIDGLLERGVLKKPTDVPYKGLFERPGKETSVEQLVCFMDPVCYLSDLSAMQWHGITDRRPKSIQVTSARGTEWTSLVQFLMEKDIKEGSYWTGGQPLKESAVIPSRGAWRTFPARIRGRPVERRQDSSWPAKMDFLDNQGVRVATIGRTYLDMIRHPARCGGIQHVLDVFEEHGRRHRNLIVREVNESGTKLDKSRVGYILNERLGVDVDSSPTLTAWLNTAVQRGGSRKLDAEADYSPTFSERWCLSLNV